MAITDTDLGTLLAEINNVENEDHRTVLLETVERLKEMHADLEDADFKQEASVHFAHMLLPESHIPCEEKGADPMEVHELCIQIMESIMMKGGQ